MTYVVTTTAWKTYCWSLMYEQCLWVRQGLCGEEMLFHRLSRKADASKNIVLSAAHLAFTALGTLNKENNKCCSHFTGLDVVGKGTKLTQVKLSLPSPIQVISVQTSSLDVHQIALKWHVHCDIDLAEAETTDHTKSTLSYTVITKINGWVFTFSDTHP